ncbi:MAG: peptide chain release factor N(5)-glutamine methyltransferase [Candidatus Moranbacteria bacterium]|nr:peptide chain release factor N(5)-glutamine methyltransferase [Candidatus Moranbacteria bacterium]
MQIETIGDLQKEYFGKIDHLDLDLIVAHSIKKTREFVMSHPEHKPTGAQLAKIKTFAQRRAKHEPLAYILGHKEFFGLNFKVSPDTLIPRPETELLVELAMQNVERETQNAKSLHDMRYTICDIGTGSGNIIISVAKTMTIDRLPMINFFAIDISKEALKIAKQNAKINAISDKIKFIHGNLLDPIIKNPTNYQLPTTNLVILANLPYLSQEIYSATLPNVKKFEPKSALWSAKEGLDHYEKLLQQIAELKSCYIFHVSCFMEISPEQKTKLPKIIKKHLPQAKTQFHKDLAGKWRVCAIKV